MNEEDRAKEIYDSMKGFRVKNSHRKKCALNCVDQIIRALSIHWKHTETPFNDSNTHRYYLKVREIIENFK